MEMKLLYIWIENHKERIKNMELTISNSYQINYDIEGNTLFIKKNNEYIKSFYGKNILDITAIVGENGVGKTTLASCLYDLCNSVHPVGEGHPDYITKHIVVYETDAPGSSRKIIVYYYLSHSLRIEKSKGVKNVIPVPLKGLQKEKFLKETQQHDMTTIYFTNSFEINHVMRNQGMSDFAEGEKHKSLSFSPMISLNNAFNFLKEHYGARKKEGLLLLDVINQYAEKMCTDFKIPYATAASNNYLMVVKHLPEDLVKIFPSMGDFKLSITEFGEYIKYQSPENFINLSQFDQTVYFIRKNIYEHIAVKFKSDPWGQIYVNILCEIVLFLNMFEDYKKVKFNILEQEHTRIESNEALEIMLGQIHNEEILAEKGLIRKIRSVETVDIVILKEFVRLTDENTAVLSLLWYQQVLNFLETYNDVKDVQVNKTLDYGSVDLIDLILSHYEDHETVYGRMINVIPNPMSSGEVALINLFSSVYKAMKMYTSSSILLIIDEIDAFLHPRWQQTILTHITSWINESAEFNEKKVQLIIATHSPIILSDIPSGKIVYLKKPCSVKSNTQLTFGANINTLFYDSFFMDEGSIGEIAKKKIQEAMNVLNNKEAEQSELDEAMFIIDNIGEKFIREKLKTHPRYIEEKEKRQG